MPPDDNIMGMGHPMSREAAIAKLEAICSSLWRQHQSDGDNYYLACCKLLEDQQTMDIWFENNSNLNQVLLNCASGFKKTLKHWEQPWKSIFPCSTMHQSSPSHNFKEQECILDIGSNEYFDHPTVVQLVDKFLKRKFKDEDIESLCNEMFCQPLDETWDIDFTQTSCNGSGKKTIKKYQEHIRSKLKNNFNLSLFEGFHSMLYKRRQRKSPKKSRTTTVNVLLSIPNVSDLFEDYNQWHRQYCNRLKTPSSYHTLYNVGKKKRLSPMKFPPELENLRKLWETPTSNQSLRSSPLLPGWKRTPSTFIRDTRPATKFISPVTSSSVTSGSKKSSISSSTSTLSSTASDGSSPGSPAVLPQEPLQPTSVLAPATAKRKKVRRRLWDDNDLLLSSSCRGLDEEDMDVCSFLEMSRSQSDPDLCRIFQEAKPDSQNLTKWGKALVDLDKIEFYPKHKGESDGDRVPQQRPVPKFTVKESVPKPPVSPIIPQITPRKQQAKFKQSFNDNGFGLLPQTPNQQNQLRWNGSYPPQKLPDLSPFKDNAAYQNHLLNTTKLNSVQVQVPPPPFIHPMLSNQQMPQQQLLYYTVQQPSFQHQNFVLPTLPQQHQNLKHQQHQQQQQQIGYGPPAFLELPDLTRPPPSLPPSIPPKQPPPPVNPNLTSPAAATASFFAPPPPMVHQNNKTNSPYQKAYSQPDHTSSKNFQSMIMTSPKTIYSVAGTKGKPRASNSFTDMILALSKMDPTTPPFVPDTDKGKQTKVSSFEQAVVCTVSSFQQPSKFIVGNSAPALTSAQMSKNILHSSNSLQSPKKTQIPSLFEMRLNENLLNPNMSQPHKILFDPMLFNPYQLVPEGGFGGGLPFFPTIPQEQLRLQQNILAQYQKIQNLKEAPFLQNKPYFIR